MMMAISGARVFPRGRYGVHLRLGFGIDRDLFDMG
jgi:hypothetical protein